MSAFVDLCFGDFTEGETLAFLSGELFPDQAHIAKTAYAELCQSPEGSQSEKDAISLSNHTEDEPTTPEEPVVFMKQSKRKVKKKIRKRRKSNSQLSDKSSSSEEDFQPSLPAEFDVKPVEVKDDESEEKQDISPPSSHVEDLEGDDGAAKVQPHTWSNLNKKPRSSSTSSSSQTGNQTRRKPSPRHAIQRGQDAGKKWKEENISDGDDSETSGENRDGPSAAGFTNGQVKSTNNCDNNMKESQLKSKEPDTPSTESVEAPTQPPAPKRWADLFSKPSNQKSDASTNAVKPPAQNGTIKSEKAGQQKPPPSQNGPYRKKRSDYGRKDSTERAKNSTNAPANHNHTQKERSPSVPTDPKPTVTEQKAQTQGPRQDRLRSGHSRKEAHDTPLAGRDPDRSKKIAQTMPINGEVKELSFDCGSVLEFRNEQGNEGNASLAAVAQEKKAGELPRKGQDAMPRNKVLAKEQSQDTLVVNHAVIDHTPVPEPSVPEAQKDMPAAGEGKETVVPDDGYLEYESKEEVHADDAVTPEKDVDSGENKEAPKEGGNKANAEEGTKPPGDEPQATTEPSASSGNTKEKPREDKDQKVVNAAPASKGNPWQTSKKWSDLFVTSKQQEEVNSTKKPTDFKNVNGFGTNDNGPVKKQTVQKVLTLEEQEKLHLAMEVSEIIRKCSLNQSIGDVPYPRGLINTSNWCYINSTLQALIACPKLVMCLRALIPLVDRLKTMAPYSGAIVELLKEFQYMEGDWSTQRKRMPDVKGPPFEPQGVYRALEQLNNHLTTAKEHHQHDAEEYLTTSLGRIDHELTELLEMAAQHSDPVEEEEEEEVQNGGVWKEVYKKNKSTVTRRITANDTPITQIFGGEFRSYIYRNNKIDSSMVEPFLTLSLSVDGGVMSIEESLRKDFGKEDVVGEEESVTKKLLFERLPNVMIIQLKKFSYDSSNGCVKLKKNLAFYDELIIDKDLMSPFVSTKYSAEKDRSYRLCAVLYHAGRNAYCGHYVTAAKYIQQWLLFDDNLVRNIALKRVLQPEGREPYILFYSRY